MTIDQVIAALRDEKQNKIASRFPCRAIMVDNVQQYHDLIEKLQTINDISVVSSEELFSSADVMPRYENLKDPKYRNRWVILPGVSEYLRLFSKNEAETQRFAKIWSYKAPSDSTGRIIIPLWGCVSQWHDKSLRLCQDKRQDEFYFDCVDSDSPIQRMNLLVLSGEFEQHIDSLRAQKGQMFISLQEWYEYWMSPVAETIDQVLLTKRYGSIQPTFGSITIKIIKDTFSFVKENLRDGHVLSKNNCPDEASTLLFDISSNGFTVDRAILSKLNIMTFSGIDVMSKWNTMSTGQKQLAVLWMNLHPDDSYLCHCVEASDEIGDIPTHILYDIFALRHSHPNWVDESQHLIKAMNLQKKAKFFAELDKLPVYEERLGYLSGASKEERVYLLRMVGKWMREDANQALNSEALKCVFPQLHAYLDHRHVSLDEELQRYLGLYKAHKLENTLPVDEDIYFHGIDTEKYDFRYTALSNALDDNCIFLWIDALGVEWLSLLIWTLHNSRKGDIKQTLVTQATLPTETEFNEQWKQMNMPHRKLDKLDKLAHKGVIDDPDYYACIEDQFSFITSLCETVGELLSEYHRVIITGDHGSSRLAARFFHKRDGLTPPAAATVCSHGRYCQLSAPYGADDPRLRTIQDQNGNKYLVVKNYDHFTQSGFATGTDDEKAIFGEIHGGATPEEALVPVIVIDNKKELPLTAQWKMNPVKIVNKKVKATLEFSRTVQNLSVKIGAIEGLVAPQNDKKLWDVVFERVAKGTHHVAVAADNILVSVPELTVRPALEGDGDLL